MIDLDRIEALANAAGVTHQPWSVAGLALLLRFGDKNDGPWNDASDDVEYLPRSHDDAALIVALVGDMPALVAELRAARAEIERLRTAAAEECADVVAWLDESPLTRGVARDIARGAHVGAAKGGERG